MRRPVSVCYGHPYRQEHAVNHYLMSVAMVVVVVLATMAGAAAQDAKEAALALAPRAR